MAIAGWILIGLGIVITIMNRIVDWNGQKTPASMIVYSITTCLIIMNASWIIFG